MSDERPSDEPQGWEGPISGEREEATPPHSPSAFDNEATQPGWAQPTDRQPAPGWQAPPPPGGPPPGWGAPPPGQQPPPGWGPPSGGYPYQPGYGAAPPTESTAIIALVLGIASFLLCPILPAIAAIIVGGNAEKKIVNSGGALQGDGLAKAGRIIGWANIALYGLVLVGFVLFIAFFGFVGAATSSTTTF